MKKNVLKKNEIIKDEFFNETWWCRAELNIFDFYGYIIKDFDSLIKYSNLLLYYDFIDHGIFLKNENNILNNTFNILFKKKYLYKKKYNNIKINLKKKIIYY